MGAAGARLTGVRRKARVRPLWSPVPEICPASLMADAVVRTQPEPVGMLVLRSLIAPFFQRKARDAPSAATESPTTCTEALIPLGGLLALGPIARRHAVT